MNWLNVFGLIIMILIMIPNIIFALKEKNFENKYKNRLIEIIEQIGRFASMGLMVFNLPFLDYGYWFHNGESIYFITTSVLASLYCFIWFLFFRKATLEKAMCLALIPTFIFLLSGIMQGKVLLLISSILFGIGHIIITYHNNR